MFRYKKTRVEIRINLIITDNIINKILITRKILFEIKKIEKICDSKFELKNTGLKIK